MVDLSVFRLPAGGTLMQQVQELIDQCLPGTIGLRLVRLAPDESECLVEYRRETAGLHGFMHGGTVYAVCDTLTALMLLFHGDSGVRNIVTVSAQIRYLRSLARGDSLRVVAKLRSVSGRDRTVVADCFDGAGARIAQGRFRCRLIGP